MKMEVRADLVNDNSIHSNIEAKMWSWIRKEMPFRNDFIPWIIDPAEYTTKPLLRIITDINQVIRISSGQNNTKTWLLQVDMDSEEPIQLPEAHHA